MNLPAALRIARRDLRGGLRGFTVLLFSLVLGVAAIAAVGTVRDSIRTALAEQGAVLLGGDAQMSFTYRYASPDERAFMQANALRVSEIVDFRSMAVVGEGEAAQRALTQVKAVDDAWPLVGEAVLDPPMPLAEALAPADGVAGAVMEGVLADRLGLAVGDRFRLGTATFRLSARLVREPDAAGAGFSFGPRTIVRTADLAGSGLLEPGSLFDSRYRLLLAPGTDLAALEARARERFGDTGLRWQDRRSGAPGAERFVSRMGAFLVLVGLAGLAVGGVGVASAVSAWLTRRRETIATLRAVGADGATLHAIFLIQIAAVAALGVALGLVLGAAIPWAAGPFIASSLPIPVSVRPSVAALAEAALYGLIVAALFALWPLARLSEVKAAALFRDETRRIRRLPPAWAVAVTGLLAAALAGASVWLSGVPSLALGTLGGIAGALLLLAVVAAALRRLVRRLARHTGGRPGLRLALAAIGSPRAETTAVVLALGLGLSVMASVGQIDANLRAAIDRDLPKVAPTWFFVDIQPDQIAGFRSRLASDPAVSKVEDAPMLRGILTRINGRDAREVAGDHWVLRGDRGITYSDAPPPNTRVVEGRWWPAGYDGPPQVSFAAKEAAELGLKPGDRVMVNILGRDIEAEITSLREVDFSTAGIGFVMVMDPAALKGAPHSYIATVYAAPEAEAAILRDLATAYPNITAIRVRDQLDRVSEALSAIAQATLIASLVTLMTGAVVLIGAASAGEAARAQEAAVLRTLGATRRQVLASFALRSALMGAAAGIIAILVGAVAGWSVMAVVMDLRYHFEPVSALMIVAGGAAASLLAGLAFALRPLSLRPARVLRARD